MKKFAGMLFMFFFISTTQHLLAQYEYSNPAAINASMQYNNMTGLYHIQNMQTNFDRINNSREPSTHPGKKNSPPQKRTPALSLTVGHDPKISKQIRDQFIANVTKTSGKENAEKTDKFLGDISTTFGKMVAPYGLQNDNYIDVMTAYLVVMWMSVNKQTKLPSTTQIQAVKNQISGTPVKLDEQQRQTSAEIFMYQTCVAVIARENAVKQSDNRLLVQLSEQTSKNLSRQGVNLNNLLLTNNGFSRK